MMVKVAVLLDQHAYNMPADELIDAVKRIEKLGFESVWLLDSFSRDPFITASFILSRTDKISVGTGIATVYSRDAMASVQARETLSEYYPGRFLMGLGASNAMIVKMRGGTWVPPVPKMSAYLEEMSKIELAHSRPGTMAPLYIAAHAPGLQDLALKYTKGIITWILPVESIRTARNYVGPDLEITANFPCVVNPDPEAARKVARDFLSPYLAIDYYRAAYSKIGFDIDDFENGGSDRLIDAIVAWGDPARIKQRADEYVSAGATRIVLNPVREAAAGQSMGIEMNADADLDSLNQLAPVLL